MIPRAPFGHAACDLAGVAMVMRWLVVSFSCISFVACSTAPAAAPCEQLWTMRAAWYERCSFAPSIGRAPFVESCIGIANSACGSCSGVTLPPANDPGARRTVPLPMQQEGEPCTKAGACGPGFVCDLELRLAGPDGVCVPAGQPGDRCPCDPSLACVAGKCRVYNDALCR